MPLPFPRPVLLLFAFAFSASAAQFAPAQLQPAANNSVTYPLDGVVLNSATGEPIRAALVQVHARAQISVLTGTDGKFHFEGLAQGPNNVSVRKPGFFSEQQDPRRNNLVQVSANMQSVVLKLVPESVIYGRVTDQNGEPAERLPVKLMYQNVENGEMRWQQRGAQTNEDGEFRMFGLQAGTYYLKAGPSSTPTDQGPNLSQRRRQGYAGTYYPGAPDLASATAIKAVPGQEFRADLNLKTAPFYQVTGTVVGSPLGVPYGVRFLTKEGEPLPSGVGINTSTGSFIASSIPAGPYIIKAFATIGNGQQMLIANLPLDVNSDVAGVRLVLGQPATIPVNVEFHLSPKSNSGFNPGRAQPISVELISSKSALSVQRFQASPEGPPENRSLAIRNLEPGIYNVQIRPSGPWYVESAQCGSTNLLTRELVVTTGGSGQPIEVVLRDDFATIEAVVLSDGRATPATVLVISENNSTMATTLFVNESGKLQKTNLAPGEYRVFAFDRVDGLEYANPEAMRPYLTGAQFIRVAPGGQASLNLELQKRGD
jgi:hypothetical protein